MELRNKTIAFLGDSITEGAGASAPQKKFVEVFAELTGAKVLNYGIGGTRIAPQRKPSETARYDLDFIMRADDMEQNVDAVVVFGGTNDFGHGDAPFGKITDTSSETFCGACDVLMSKLIKKYPDIPIVIATPLHRLTEDYLINKIMLERKALSEYVEVIRKKAEKFSLPVIDLFAASGMQPNIEEQNSLYFADGLHPNDLGHRRLAKIFADFLRNIISTKEL